MRLLVIDDVELNGVLLASAVKDLCNEGITLATRATEGIEAAIHERPGLIFMDIGLPDLDGVMATKILKANPQTSHIPVIAVSAHAVSEYQRDALAAGCEAYVTKPISIKGIRGIVQSYKDRVRQRPLAHSTPINIQLEEKRAQFPC
jgi:two-component system, cell cycle response regulator DivK